jgi:tetratricopeptide (TPR) repeat protein
MRPLCFVLMPFGKKKDSSGRVRDFDAAYQKIIQPAIEAAEMEPVRADEELVGGWIHKPMFERLMLCDYAVADLTGENPNVFYELGIRHALRPYSTVVIFEEGSVLPFDVAPLRGIPYSQKKAARGIELLTERLREARQCADDSPVYNFLLDLPRPQLDHSRTDVFRALVEHAKKTRQELSAATAKGAAGLEQILEIRKRFGNLADVDTGTVIAIFLSFRAVEAYAEMVKFFDGLPRPLQRNRMMREQLGLALNRAGRPADAEKVLKEVIEEYGASPETNGILGRVYKDRYNAALAAGDATMARGCLKRAIDCYLEGFEADWRDAYPGVNAVTLMELAPAPDPRQAAVLPVVRYAASRKAATSADYWDHATLLELAVLADDREAAETHLADALPLAGDEIFRLRTTADNLRMIRRNRERQGREAKWIEATENQLYGLADRMANPG